METIIKFGARSNTELMKETGRSKDTIIEHTKRMKNKAIINKKGKKGKWYLTNNAYHYPQLRASIFRKKAISKILKDNFPLAERIDFPSTINENIPTNLDWKNQLNRQDVSHPEQLSKFVSKIGCYIAYCFIKAMEPNIWKSKIDITEIEFMLGNDKDKVIKEWIENCIDISEVFREFCNLKIVKQGLARGTPNKPPTFNKIFQLIEQSSKIQNIKLSHSKINELAIKIHSQYKSLYEKNSKRKLNPEDPAWSLYELDNNTYSELLEKLKCIYPNVVKELNKITKQLPELVNMEISLAYDPDHTLCKGKIELIKIQNFQNTVTKKQCNECKRIFPTDL
jgi:hypothetical protein